MIKYIYVNDIIYMNCQGFVVNTLVHYLVMEENMLYSIQFSVNKDSLHNSLIFPTGRY